MKINRDKPIITCEDLIKKYHKIKVDHSFQRKGGVGYGSGWKQKDYPKYIKSVMSGKAANTITLLNIEKCLEDLLERENSEQYVNSIEYYTSCLEEGATHLSIDGNNSTSGIVHFSKDAFPSVNGKLFSELPEKMQEKFLSREISYQEVEDASLEEACELFRLMNSSTPLNAQERRQARITPLSSFVREVAEESESFFDKFTFRNVEDLHQRKHEEFIAQILLKETSTGYLGKGQLDDLYENTSDIAEDTKKRIEKNLEELVTIATNVGKIHQLRKGTCLGLYSVVDDILNKRKLLIGDHSRFFEWFAKDVVQWSTESRGIKKEDEEKLSYVIWADRYAIFYKNLLQKHLKSLEDSLEKLKEDKILLEQRTSSDDFDTITKARALVQQKYKDREGNDLTATDFMKGKYHGDHVKSVKDGGKTELSNCEIMTKENNLKKGAKTNEPVFEHQQPDLFEKKAAG